MDSTRHAEAVLRLGVNHGVPTRDHAPRLGDLVATPAKHLRDDGLRHLARKPRDGEREHDLAAHRVDVRHRVDRGHSTPRPGVIHDRREKVDGLDDRQIGSETIHRGVVRRAETDEQVRRRRRSAGLQHRQHLLEISRSHFRRSAGAGGVRSEADLRVGVFGHCGYLDARSGSWDSTKSTKAWASGERLRSRWVTR